MSRKVVEADLSGTCDYAGPTPLNPALWWKRSISIPFRKSDLYDPIEQILLDRFGQGRFVL